MMTSPWAIVPDKLIEIRSIYETHLHGPKIDLEKVEASLGRPLDNRQPRDYEIENGVAVIPVQGVIAPKANLFTQISGGASSQIIERQVAEAMNDPQVIGILLDVDSPGGSVFGTFEAAEVIRTAAGNKPTAAWTSGQMSSAAYLMGSAAGSVYMSSGAPVMGSIGVVATHVDTSRREQMMGVRTTEITAGKYKRIASQFGPLSDEGRASIQDQVDAYYALFVNAVAAHRGVDVEAVLERMADGKLFIGQQAIDAGLADGVMPRAQLIELLRGRGSRASANGAGVAPLTHFRKERLMANEKPVATLESIRADHPEIARALIEEGRAAGMDAGKKEGHTAGLAEGQLSERQRIAGIEEQAMVGYESIVAEAKADGKSTGAEVAMRIIKAQKAEGQDRLNKIRTEAPNPVPNASAPAKEAPAKEGKPETTAHDLSARASAYMAEQSRLGHKVSASDAVAHVMRQAALAT